MRQNGRIWLGAWCWLGAALRYRGLFANSFHADEALFAGWARLIAVWRDYLLLTQAVDKPPLLFYLQASFYPFLGPVEWAARMPSFIASLLLIPLTAQLARRLTGDRTAAVVAAAIVAIAPLTIQFSATAFSDPLLTFWLTAALYAAVRPRRAATGRSHGAILAGFLFGLALATKYQALLFAPLVIGIGWITGRQWKEFWRGLVGVGVVILLLVLWQGARPGAGALVELQWSNIGGIRPAYSWELWSRLLDLAHLWRYALGWPLLIASVVISGAVLWAGREHGRPEPAVRMLALFIAAYVLVHWLWAVPAWDRYLLPILPLAAILAGCGISLIWSAIGDRPYPRIAFTLVVAVVVIAAIPTAAEAYAGRYPIGGRADADGGAAGAARLLKDAPYGTVLYDHWYSWHWRYQLFDRRVYVSWFPHADALLDDLSAFGGRGPARYIALPASAVASPVVRILAERGYRLERLSGQDDTASMTLYRIVTAETAE